MKFMKYVILVVIMSAAGTVYGAEQKVPLTDKQLEHLSKLWPADSKDFFQSVFDGFQEAQKDPQFQAVMEQLTKPHSKKTLLKAAKEGLKSFSKDMSERRKSLPREKIQELFFGICSGQLGNGPKVVIKNLDEALEDGANVHETNQQGYTPLLLAIEQGHHIKVIDYLVQKGSDVTATVDGQNAAQLAKEQDNHDLASYLESCIKKAEAIAKRDKKKAKKKEEQHQKATTPTAASAAVKTEQKSKKQLEQERKERATKLAEQQRAAAAVLAAQKAEEQRLAKIEYEQELEATRVRLEQEELDKTNTAAVEERLGELVTDVVESNARYQKNMDAQVEFLSNATVDKAMAELVQEKNKAIKELEDAKKLGQENARLKMIKEAEETEAQLQAARQRTAAKEAEKAAAKIAALAAEKKKKEALHMLWCGSSTGNNLMISAALANKDINVNTPLNSEGATALLIAVGYHQPESVKTLLESGATVSSYMRTQAAQQAIKCNDFSIVKLLKPQTPASAAAKK